MFHVLGGDGKQYGPASTEQVLQWLAEQRLTAQSRLRREGEPDWRLLIDYPEFAHVATLSLSSTSDATAREDALSAVKAPAWGMIASGILGFLWCLLQLILTVLQGPSSNPLLELLGQSQAQAVGLMVGMIGSLVVGMIWAGFVAFAGYKLLRLESRGLVITATILMMIPCFGSSLPICLVSLPLGIWALVAVNRVEVRSQFP